MESQMKLLNFIKEKIMPRPKGSKNKTTVNEVVEPVEFDYERDDGMFDNSYQNTAYKVVRNEQPAWTLSTQDAALLVPPSEPLPSPILTSQVQRSDALIGQPKLYLVEGEVQMSPRELGRGSVVAKQFRLVQANDESQAVDKYSNYFRSLSDGDAVYTTLRAAAMETIS
jgi:hypothetical protein